MIKLIPIFAVILLFSCKKTPLLETSDAMVGTWVHYSAENTSHTIIINEDGTGSMEWRYEGEVTRGTKVRDWFLDDNTLSFGKASFNGEQYEVEKYPTFTWEEIIFYYDTIAEGSYYMILDDFYYAGQ